MDEEESREKNSKETIKDADIDSLYLALFFDTFYNNSLMINKEKGISLTTGNKTLCNLKHDLGELPDFDLNNVISIPQKFGIIPKIIPQDSSNEELFLDQYVKRKSELWKVDDDTPYTWFKPTKSYKELISNPDDTLLEKPEYKKCQIIYGLAKIYSKFNQQQLNILTTNRNLTTTIKCVAFNISDWYQNHFIKLFDKFKKMIPTLKQKEGFFLFEQNDITFIRENLAEMAIHIKQSLMKFFSFRDIEFIKNLMLDDFDKNEIVSFRSDIRNILQLREEINLDFLYDQIIDDFILFDELSSYTKSPKLLRELTSLFRSILSKIKVKVIYPNSQIIETIESPKAYDFTRFLKRLELSPADYENFESYITENIKTINNLKKSTRAKRRVLNNLIDVFFSLYIKIRAKDHMYNFETMEEIPPDVLAKISSIARIKQYLRRLDKLFELYNKEISFENKQHYAHKILSEVLSNTKFLKEHSLKFKQFEPPSHTNGYYIQTLAKTLTKDKKKVFGPEILIRWAMTGFDKTINDNDIEEFVDNLLSSDARVGILIFDNKIIKKPLTLSTKCILNDKSLILVPTLDRDIFSDFRIILGREGPGFERNIKELLNQIAEKIERVTPNIEEELVKKIELLLDNPVAIDFLHHALDRKKDPYELRDVLKHISEKQKKIAYNRHDLIHTLTVTYVALRLLSILYLNKDKIRLDNNKTLEFKSVLEYDEFQIAYLMACLWHDTGYDIKNDKTHPKSSEKNLRDLWTLKIETFFEERNANSVFSSNKLRLARIKNLALKLILYHSARSGKTDDNEIAIIRIADVLDTSFIRQTATYLRELIGDKRKFEKEFNVTEIFEHELGILLIDNIEFDYIDSERKIVIRLNVDDIDNYRPAIPPWNGFVTQLFSITPRLRTIRDKFKSIIGMNSIFMIFVNNFLYKD